MEVLNNSPHDGTTIFLLQMSTAFKNYSHWKIWASAFVRAHDCESIEKS